MAEQVPEGVTFQVVWDAPAGVPIVLVNQVLGQVGQQDEIIVSFGQLTPPPLMGDAEQQKQQAQEIPFLLVKPVARLGFTRAGLEDLIRILNETRDNYDKIQEMRATRTEEGGGP